MTAADSEQDWDFKRRDIAILRELTKQPQISSRKLAEILEAKYDIDVSHVTVNQSIRKMREADVFREAIIPNESYYLFSLFEFKFNPTYFREMWREVMNFLKADEHTIMFFVAGGEYQWKAIMMFPDLNSASRWLHEFYKEYGKFVLNVRNTTVTNMLKFGTDPALFDGLSDEEIAPDVYD